MLPTIPGGSPPPAYAPSLLDTPVVQSHQPILPPPGYHRGYCRSQRDP